MRFLRITLVSLVVTGGLVAAVTVATSSGSGTDGAPPRSITKAYGVLSTPPASLSDGALAMARGVAKRYAASDASARALDPAAARVLRSDGEQTTYLLANDSVACLMSYGPQRYYACTTASTATSRTQALVNTAASGDQTAVEVLLPDGAADVRAMSDAGQDVPLTLANNLATGRVTGRVTSVTWSNDDGSSGTTAVPEVLPPRP